MTFTSVLLIAAGLALLIANGELLVRGASGLAPAAGVSRLAIGLTIVAFGTSAPEMLVCVYSSAVGKPDIAVANIVGSNIFNILGILGVSSLVASPRLSVAASLINVDVPAMIAAAVICLPLFFTGHSLKRWEGLLFLGYYAACIAYLIMASSLHDLLPAFSRTMILFVVPVTVLAILLAVVSEWRAGRRGSVS